ncbi:hypothetical protein QFC22_001613 [Naganishia vaughanmartiniae]|uniref:Uncharacterized protein n=1 Tax=Naganishia vaughanmartiniae TaxID=1424756 RepID=A0ACC2XIE7_9TREE|nr:hypothetical protein QFC22_001613 [Naganishia vaughanmartiniae]
MQNLGANGSTLRIQFEFATPSFPNDLFTSTPKTTILERLSQTDNDDDTPDIPQLSSSAGRPVWESESYPTEKQHQGTSKSKDLAAVNEINIGEGRRLPKSTENDSESAMAVHSCRTVSASSLTGVMDDLAGRGSYGLYTSRASPPGVRTRIGDVLDDEANDGEVIRDERARWNVASSPSGEDVRSSGLRATQRIQRMGEGVMLEMSDLLGQELVD